MAKPGRGSDQFPLRLPPGMREQIKLSAEQSGRSMNEEILEVLREYFPEQPGFDELVKQVDYTIALLESLKLEQSSGGLTPADKVQVVLNRLDSTNDHLRKLANSRSPSVVKLDKEVSEGVQNLLLDWDFVFEGSEDSVVNGLIQMGLDRIENDKDNLKLFIGEGETRRIVEITHPSKENEK